MGKKNRNRKAKRAAFKKRELERRARVRAARFRDERTQQMFPAPCSRPIRQETENDLPSSHSLVAIGADPLATLLCEECGAATNLRDEPSDAYDLHAEREFGLQILTLMAEDREAIAAAARCRGGSLSLASQLQEGPVVHPPAYLHESRCGDEYHIECDACGAYVHGPPLADPLRRPLIHGTLEECRHWEEAMGVPMHPPLHLSDRS